MQFDEWITMQYVAWRGNAVGREKTMKDFANYLGVSPQLLSDWMKPGGKVPTSAKMVNLLLDKFGDEVLEFIPPDRAPDFGNVLEHDQETSKILDYLRQLPAGVRPQVTSAIRQALEDVIRQDPKPSEDMVVGYLTLSMLIDVLEKASPDRRPGLEDAVQKTREAFQKPE